MGQTIQQGAGETFCAEGFRPFFEWQVTCDQGRAAFVALRDQLEEELSSSFAERYEAQLVDDQQLHLGQLPQPPPFRQQHADT